MSLQLEQVTTALLSAEADCPTSFAILPHQLRKLADAMLSDGFFEQSVTISQQASKLERHSQEPQAVREIFDILSESLDYVRQADSHADIPTAADIEQLIAEPDVTPPVVDEAADEDFVRTFLTEAGEHLEAAEQLVLQLETCAHDAAALQELFRHVHSLKGTSRLFGFADLGHFAQSVEDVLDLARRDHRHLTDAVIQVLIESLDVLRRLLMQLNTNTPASDADGQTACRIQSQLNEIYEQAQALPFSAVAPADDSPAVTSKTNEAQPEAPPVASLPLTADQVEPNSTAPEGNASKSIIRQVEAVRVDRMRLDELIDLVGELVICESMVQESCGSRDADRTENHSLQQLRKITRELQELSLGLRMVPIRGLFQKGTRLVRDLSRKVQKPVDVVQDGEDTELDKSVVDQISDPLVHILRNSMDHGIESSVEERLAAGKPERATITLKAFHQSGEICIEIRDDGRGLNRARIHQKAVERGLIRPEQQLSDDDIYQLIFRPGFSTAEKVTDLSGRGVGMDVVKQNIEALRGTVQLSSVPGHGTRLLIRLPLTLGIIDGMIVRAGCERFIVPTSLIVELIQPRVEDLLHIQHRGLLLNVRGASVPCFRLDATFDLPSDTSETNQSIDSAIGAATGLSATSIVVLVEDKDRLAGLIVDQVIGRQQVVIKGLRGMQGDLRSFAGCAVLPDGLVGLILDVPATLDRARSSSC